MIIKKCEYCGEKYKSYLSDNRKFCSRECFYKGKDQTNRLRGDNWYEAMKNVDLGHWRGKKNPKSSNTKIQKYKSGELVPWNKGKQNVQPKLLGKNHPRIKKQMKTLGIGWDEYNNWVESKEEYYRMVWRITNQQPISTLPNADKKRGRAGIKGAYQLDHIIPMNEGFYKSISPDIIGRIDNLQFITWEDNLKKRRNYNYNKNKMS